MTMKNIDKYEREISQLVNEGNARQQLGYK